MATTEHAKQKALDISTTRSKETSVAITASKAGVTLLANDPAKFVKQLDNTTLPASYVLSTVATVAGIALPTPTYEWSYSLDTAPTTWTVITSATTSSLTVTNTNFNSYITGTATSVTFKVKITKTGFVSSEDYYTIYYFDESKDVVVVSINNPNILISTDTSGNPVLTNSGCEITVTVNGVKIPYGTTGANTYSIGTPTQDPTGGVTLASPTTSTDGFTRTYGSITAITADLVIVTFPVTIRNQFGTAKPVTNVTQKFVRGKAGADAKAISLSATAVSFSYDAANALLSPASSTITITPANITTSPWYWTVTVGAGTESSRTSSATATTYSYTPQSSFTNMPQTLTFKAYEALTGGTAVATASIGMAATRVGDAGIPNKSVTVFAYIWSNLASPGPTFTSTSFNYTWSDGTISAYPTNAAGESWTASAGASPGNGYSLYAIQKTITALTTATVTATSWSGAVKSIFGYTEKGSIGFTGQGHYIAYRKIASTDGIPPTPTAGTDFPPTGATTSTNSATYTWSSSPSSITLSVGEVQYQSDGFKAAGSDTITWNAPYPSYLKVGSLQAIVANLGVVEVATDGWLYSGKTTSTSTAAGFFLGKAGNDHIFFIGNSGDTKSVRWSGSDLTIKGGSLTGSSFATASGTGQRITINSGSDNRVKGYNGSGTEIFSIGGDGTGSGGASLAVIPSNTDPIFNITPNWSTSYFGLVQKISTPNLALDTMPTYVGNKLFVAFSVTTTDTNNYVDIATRFNNNTNGPNGYQENVYYGLKIGANLGDAAAYNTLGAKVFLGVVTHDKVDYVSGYGGYFSFKDNNTADAEITLCNNLNDAIKITKGNLNINGTDSLFKWGSYSYSKPDGTSTKALFADGTWSPGVRAEALGTASNFNSITTSRMSTVYANANKPINGAGKTSTDPEFFYLINIRKSDDAANYGLQLATGVTENRNKLFFRAQTNSTTWDAWTELGASTGGGGTGTVTSVGLTVPTGLSVSGSPVTGSGTIAVSLATGYSIPTTSSQTNWDTAYTDRLKWDGGATGLTASTGRTSLGATTVGSNLFTLTNVAAVRFIKINADNTITTEDASTFRSSIGAGTGNGTITAVTATSPISATTTTGSVALSLSTVGVASGGTGATTFTAGYLKASGTTAFTTVSKVAEADLDLNTRNAGQVLAGPDSSGVSPIAPATPSWRQLNFADISGTLGVARGGTGATTFTAGYLKANGTNTFTTVSSVSESDLSYSNKSSGYVLCGPNKTAPGADPAAAAPTWKKLTFYSMDFTGVSVVTALKNAGGATTSGTGDITLTGSTGLSGYAVTWTIPTASSANVDISATSDIRLKKDIQNIDIGLQFIEKLRPVSFKWNNKILNDGEKTNYGFIAQEVEDLVGTNTALVGDITQGDLAGYKSFSNDGIVAALVKAVQELTERVKQLEQGN